MKARTVAACAWTGECAFTTAAQKATDSGYRPTCFDVLDIRRLASKASMSSIR
jgi:hypothetical protein